MTSILRRWPGYVLSAMLLVALLPLSALDAGSVAAADGWTNVTSNLANMQSECGNLTLLSPVPHSNTLIAGVAKQGLWATSDGGASWQALGMGKGSARITNRPSWISYDPLNPAHFYESGTYNESGIFDTTDGGTTFAQLGTVNHNDFVSIDYTDPDRKTLLVGGHEQPRTVWKSTNGGKSWTNVGGDLPGAGYSNYPLIVDAQTYLVNVGGSDRGSGIYRTTDAGATWNNLSFPGPNGAPLVTSDGTIYWVVGDALAKSSDHGATWSSVGGGFMNGLHPIEVTGGRLVTAQSDTLVVSSDGGATWVPFGPKLPYPPGGVVYSENQKALFIWHSDCGTQVLPDAIQKLSFDFTAAAASIAPAGTGATAAKAAPVQLLANWVSPTYLTAGQSLTVHQDAFAHQGVSFTLSVDVLDSQGQPVLHTSLDNQALAAEQTTPLVLTIPLPTSLQSGTYVVKTTALGPDGTQYAGSASAGKFVAIALPPTSMPAPSDDAVDDPDQSQSAPSDGQ
jgi:photosystem II stability/assembly factor-like uncharacterized protein